MNTILLTLGMQKSRVPVDPLNPDSKLVAQSLRLLANSQQLTASINILFPPLLEDQEGPDGFVAVFGIGGMKFLF